MTRQPDGEPDTRGKEALHRPGRDTPMMAQYRRAKDGHPDAVLLFRMGDFYETFNEDAHILSAVTGIALTSRNSGDPDPIPLAGFPWHNSEPYIAQLLKAGHRVAVCEQVEEPGKGKKLLERRVTEVLSPGTALNSSLLQAGANNFLAAVAGSGGVIGMAAVDLSTGEFLLAEGSEREIREELVRLAPSEALLPHPRPRELDAVLEALEPSPFRTEWDSWRFDPGRGRKLLLERFRVATLDGFEVEELAPALSAAGALLDYSAEQKQSELGHLRPPRRLRPDDGLILDESTLRSLEILDPLPGGAPDGTLLRTIDRTLTAPGARRLRAGLQRPSCRVDEIEARLDAVESLLDESLRPGLREELKGAADLERILGRLHLKRAVPRDLGALRDTLGKLPRIAALLDQCAGFHPAASLRKESLELLHDRLRTALAEQLPAALSDGGVFLDSWDQELAELRSLSRNAKSHIAALQDRERAATGISTLKVGYNRVFGYYIEVGKSHAHRIPDRFQRKQTLTSAERYLTPELKEFEQRVLGSQEGEQRRERLLFEGLCSEVRDHTRDLQHLAGDLADIDFIQAMADCAARRRWVRPKIDDGRETVILDGRHPVVEVSLGPGEFVPNDTRLDQEGRQILILTGPNMAGKSTYLRQVGHIVILAQTGSFVPATEARIGLCDRVFTRVGAHDSLSRGQSTFLVEMIETSRILHQATERSLVLLDEVGRGTSTYDGLSIAWAVAEALESRRGSRPRTIFATHFHELTRLARPGRGFCNLTVQVKEWGDRVVFLRRVVDGAADRSYGIHVAQLAGVPDGVIRRARVILERLEEESRRIAPAVEGDPGDGADRADNRQLALFTAHDPPFVRELRDMDPNRLTPLEALETLIRWREML